ncbi:MFS transporter [Nocardioides sp. HDW12B]|uniref:MFS transporter n=1 Tax=Nocardioides sp. HDW12B TaxID=2714939 RepID=UPI00198218A0|nr:MFS transporter [Nocardioides sp. HDW12B]
MTHDDARRFWTYWGASTTSAVGSAVSAVALPLTALLVLDASTFEMGLLTAASYAAWLVLGLPAGVITQRLPLRRLQLTTDLVRALAVASVPLVWWLGGLTLAHLLLVALVVGCASVLFDVANSTFLPSVVPREQLQSRNSLMSGTFAATQLSGPPVGGGAVALVGAAPALLLDAVSYLVSALLLRRLPEAQAPQVARQPMRDMIREGWHFVTRHRVMAPCMWDATVTNFVCGGQMALFAVYLVRDLDATPALVGVLLAAEGVGSLVGAALAPRLVRAFGSARVCLAGGVVSVVGAFLIPVGDGAVGAAVFALGNVVFALGVVLLSTTTRTYRQIASPPEMLSRVMATVRFVSWGAIPLGGLVAGSLGAWLGPRGALVALAAVTVVSPLILLASPVRRLRDLEDYEAEPAVAVPG